MSFAVKKIFITFEGYLVKEMMIRRLFCFVMAAAAFAACKPAVDIDAPTITWTGNTQFSTVELSFDKTEIISVTAPAKIETLTLTLGLGNYGLLANPYISISKNKGVSGNSPVFDLINDATTAAFMTGLGFSAGQDLRGQTVADLDLVAVLRALIKGQVVENNSTFTIDINLKDQAGKAISKVAKFHYTAAPSFTWTDNPGFDTVDLSGSSIPSKLKIAAPGKVAELTVTLEYGADPILADYVKNRTTSSSMVIDLINDVMVADSFKEYFPTGKAVQDKTDVTLNFGFMKDRSYDMSSSLNVFTVRVVDKNGKEGVAQLKFKKN